MGAKEKAKSFPGTRLYQKRAEAVLPILIEYALRGDPVSYKVLAARANMPNPRNLDYVLGSIGVTLEQHRPGKIPPITGLVVNGYSGLPGKGGWGFLGVKEPTKLTRNEKSALFEKAREQIHLYPHWLEILHELSLKPASGDAGSLLDAAAQRRGGGESEEHRRLKRWVADNPRLMGLVDFDPGDTEHGLGSGDRLDVLFRSKDQWVAVEVKAAHASDAELARGLMQCIKYQAVMDAEAKVIPARQCTKHRTILFAGRQLPSIVEGLRKTLGIEFMVNTDTPS